MVAHEFQPIVCGDTWRSADRVELTGVDGSVLALVGTAPPLLVNVALRRAAQEAGALPESALFGRAAELYAEGTVAGLSPADYCQAAALATGVPYSAYARALRTLGTGVAEVPSAVLAELPAPLSGDFVVRHMPRGRTFGVVAPSNHPGPHLAWLHALALGYSVVIRPGSRDPFTPFRLAGALFEAGLPAGRLSVLPGDYESADFLISHADLALAYGGPDSVARWSAVPSVALRGPGRSKTLLARTIDQEALDLTCRAIAHDGGVLCTNTSAVLTVDDPLEIASLIATELNKAPLYAATDTRCVLPTFKRGQAEALIRAIDAMTSSSLRRIGGVTDDIVEMDDGSVVVRPLVLATDDPHHPAIGTELPFPFAVVAPWDPALGVAQVRNSLAVTVIGAPDLAEEVVREPTIRRVVIGPGDPWAVHPGLPHDGSLVGFLTEAKALIKSR